PVGKSKSLVSFFLSERPPRQLHVMRHGESAWTPTVGFHWYNKAFDSKRRIRQSVRFEHTGGAAATRPVEDFDRDTPLTLIGQFRMGEALARAGVRYTYAYSSPALRCVQTAHHLLQGAGQFRLCRVFMSPTELRSAGYNVDKDYQPHSTLEGFDRRNSRPRKYQQRAATSWSSGHRTTIEFCPIILMGYKSYVKRVCIPYNAMLCLDERPRKAPGCWPTSHPPPSAATSTAASMAPVWPRQSRLACRQLKISNSSPCTGDRDGSGLPAATSALCAASWEIRFLAAIR
uniref:Phosphoglycerate mutase (2,3-diphosphoglycerate-dependent) n=1 Tax=Macrostomum lignano TaxID=282301 RepID=A0A1I8FJW7_9PLAT